MNPLVALLIVVGPTAFADEPPSGPLAMSKPVVCRKIQAFGQFEPLDDATLTPDDKLTIYYEPTGYTITRADGSYRALFQQDASIRRKGGKEPLWTKAKMVEYEARSKLPPNQVYIRCDVSLKGIPPGDYEIDLTLIDGLDKERKVTRSVGFKVIKAPDDAEPKPSTPGPSPLPPAAKKKTIRKTARPEREAIGPAGEGSTDGSSPGRSRPRSDG